MAQMNVNDKVWQLPINVTENGTVTKTLATADTYVDKNIEITVTTPDATFERKDKGVPISEPVQKEMSAVRDSLGLKYKFPWE